MILVIDNEDSFTYNLVQFFLTQGEKVKVIRNQALAVDHCLQLKASKIVISPGPGTPKEAGVSIPIIRRWFNKIPILGVCLGHQCLAEAFGGTVVRAKRPMHGMISQIHHTKRSIFQGLLNPFQATRYHSLIVEEKTLPKVFRITARTPDGEIMGIRHKKFPVYGVQFHPESIETPEGSKLLINFLKEKPRC